MKKIDIEKLVFVILILLIYPTFAFSQFVTLDWKVHDIGEVRQLITNLGTLWPAGGKIYPYLINCEFPPHSFEEHIGEAGIWVGAITPNNDTLVSVTTSWNPWASHYEFWPPTDEPWDTIWIAGRGQKLNIPYWSNYVGLSDQDFICRYNDYNPVSLKQTLDAPLYIDVIQVSHAWSSPEPLNQIILFDFYVISAKFDLKNTYITWWADPNVGYRLPDIQQILNDDYTLFYPDLNLGMGIDAPGGADGTAYSPVGFKIIPPKNFPQDKLRWTYIWGGSPNPPGIVPPTDPEKYRELMSSGTIMASQQMATGSHFVISFGPFNLSVHDTLHFQVAEILGKGVDGVLNTAKIVDLYAKHDWKFPTPPPNPPLRYVTDNHQVKLIWNPTNLVNPETYSDPNRADGDNQPFEGYRVYKSTQSNDGPWKLLAEYDIKDKYGYNTGIKHEYLDDGLLNNFDYYYSVTAFSKPDTMLNWPSLETSILANATTVVPGPKPPNTVGQVAVVPNPYRGDINYNSYNPPWEKTPASRNFWMEQDRRIQFINLPSNCEITIYTLSGDFIDKIEHNDPQKGYEDWNLTSNVGQAISSGIYLYLVQDKNTGKVQVGKFVVIK
ncbi:MAG: hypothetical protein ACYCVH_05180 [Ignavibacteriaceae bacterium]